MNRKPVCAVTCPICGGTSRVNRSLQDESEVVRRRRCLSCGTVFYTVETDCDEARGAEIFRQYYARRSRERWKKWEEKRRNEHST